MFNEQMWRGGGGGGGQESDGEEVRTVECWWGGYGQRWSVSDRDSSRYHCLKSGCYYGANSAPNSPETSINQSTVHS